MCLQPLYHSLFRNRLDIRRTEQTAFHRRCLRYPESSVSRYIPFPGQGFDIFKQLIEGLGPKFSYFQKYPLRCPEKNIGITNGLHIAGKRDLSVLYQADLIPQILYFPLQNRFQPKVAGRYQLKCFHPVSILYLISLSFILICLRLCCQSEVITFQVSSRVGLDSADQADHMVAFFAQLFRRH